MSKIEDAMLRGFIKAAGIGITSAAFMFGDNSWANNVISPIKSMIQPHQFHYDPNATKGLIQPPNYNRFVKSLWGKETAPHYSTNWAVKGDLRSPDGPALGPLQIHKSVWEDAVMEDPALGKNRWQDATNLPYASQLELAYQNKYNKPVLKSLIRHPNNIKDIQEMAALHNGGTSRWNNPTSSVPNYVRDFMNYYKMNNNKPNPYLNPK